MSVICKRISNDQALISLSGEFDKNNISLFKNKVLDLLSEKVLTIRVNLSELDFIDAPGIGVFIAVFISLNEIGGEIILENAQVHINDLIEATQITRYITLISKEG